MFARHASASQCDPGLAAATVQLQRSVGNRRLGQLLVQRAPVAEKTKLQRLDELLDKFDVPEEKVIELLGTLDDDEKPNQLAFIAAEMSADYSDIKPFVTAGTVTDDDRKALKTDEWRRWFVKVCTNRTMKEAVTDLRFDLKTKIDWMVEERTDLGLLKSVILASPEAELGPVLADDKLKERLREDIGAKDYATAEQMLNGCCSTAARRDARACSTRRASCGRRPGGRSGHHGRDARARVRPRDPRRLAREVSGGSATGCGARRVG